MKMASLCMNGIKTTLCPYCNTKLVPFRVELEEDGLLDGWTCGCAEFKKACKEVYDDTC
jgi:hypothetical protein